ncbi:MAG: carbohydrate ABC transporter permease [Anaerolineales bacterium]
MNKISRIFKPGREPSQAINHIVIILMLIFALGPVVILGFNSLKSTAELGLNPLGPPKNILWENYPKAWVEGNFATTMRNSGFLVVVTVSSVLLLAGMAAYSLARLKPPGSNAFMVFMLVGTTIPVWMYIVPLFILWRTLGLIDSLFGLIIIYTAGNSPFAIFLLRTFMVGIPRDLEDAARIDGATEWQVFRNVIIPLAWPGFLTVGLVVALGTWGEYQLAMIFVHKPDLFPVTTSYFSFVSQFSRDWGLTSAGAIMMIAPVLIIFLALQRQFIDGLTQGGVKL